MDHHYSSIQNDDSKKTTSFENGTRFCCALAFAITFYFFLIFLIRDTKVDCLISDDVPKSLTFDQTSQAWLAYETGGFVPSESDTIEIIYPDTGNCTDGNDAPTSLSFANTTNSHAFVTCLSMLSFSFASSQQLTFTIQALVKCDDCDVVFPGCSKSVSGDWVMYQNTNVNLPNQEIVSLEIISRNTGGTVSVQGFVLW